MTRSPVELNEQQQAVVAASAAPGVVAVSAGPGSGKTATAVEVVARWIDDNGMPSAVLVLTFSRNAAAEFRERVDRRIAEIENDMGRPRSSDGLTVSTFHGLAVRICRMLGHLKGLPKGFSILPPEDLPAVVGMLAQDVLASDRAQRDVVRAIERGGLTAYLAGLRRSTTGADRERLALGEAWRAASRDFGFLDFSAAMELAVELAGSRAGRSYLTGRWRWILVDEAQDTDPTQVEFLDVLDATTTVVVGDHDQAVFAFRGADDTYLRELITREDVTTVRLFQNYRSGPEILAAANRLRGGDDLQTLIAARVPSSRIDLLEYRDEDEQEEGIAAEVLTSIRRGVSPREIAVLYRTNSEGRGYAEALKRLGVPVRVLGPDAFDTRAARTFARIARLVLLPTSDLEFLLALGDLELATWSEVQALRRLARERRLALYEFVLEDELDDAVGLFARAMLAARRALAYDAENGAQDSIGEVFAFGAVLVVEGAVGLWNRLELLHGSETAEQLQPFFDAVEAWETARLTAGEPGGLVDLLDWLAVRRYEAGGDTVERPDAVTLVTMHGSKGLEWDEVFLTSAFDGRIPLARNPVDDERRLAFVAVTRARHRLVVTVPESYWTPDGEFDAEPSRFIEEAGIGPADCGEDDRPDDP